MAGVEAMPQSNALAPQPRTADSAAFCKAAAVSRESVPTAIVRSSGCRAGFFAKKATNAEAIRLTVSADSVTGSPATPSIATPRT